MTTRPALLHKSSMQILTEDYTPIDLDNPPADLLDPHFATLEFDVEPDLYFRPLLYVEAYTTTAFELKIGSARLIVPSDWCIMLGDPETGLVDVLKLDKLNGRDFHSLIMTPDGARPFYAPVSIERLIDAHDFVEPKIKSDTLLAISVQDSACAFFGRSDKSFQNVDLTDIF
jgi:hypothetical protein